MCPKDELGIGVGLPESYRHKGYRSPWGDVFQIHKSGLEVVDQTREELLGPGKCLSPSRPHSLAILKLSGKAAVLRPPGNLSGWDPTSQQLSCHQLLQGEMTPSGQTPAPSPREVPPAPGGAVEALGSAGGVSAASPLPEKELADTADSREHLLGMLRHVQESLEAAEAPERCGRRSQGKIWELRFFCDLFFFYCGRIHIT